MTKGILIFFSFFLLNHIAFGQNEFQTNYYDLVKQVRDIAKKANQPLKVSRNSFREEIFELVKTTHRLQEEALTEAIDHPNNEKVFADIAFGCKICDAILESVDLKIKYNSKKYDSYIEKLKQIELAITIQIKTQEKIK